MGDSGYGGGRLACRWAGWRDRLAGRHRQANARAGYLSPPSGRGGLVWVKAGAERDSVAIAADLAGAVLERRRDLRLALTFEQAHPEALDRLDGLTRIGVGFGPADYAAAIRRTLHRLSPLGVIEVATELRPRLSTALSARGLHHAVIDCFPCAEPAPSPEWVLTARTGQHESWLCADTPGELLGPSDPLTLLTQAQLEPSLRALTGCDAEAPLLWLHGPPVEQLNRYLANWRAIRMESGPGLLAISADGAGTRHALAEVLRTVQPDFCSTRSWNRRPLAPGSVMLVDSPRWIPAVAVACHAALLVDAARAVCWQAMAAGAAIVGGALCAPGGPPFALSDPSCIDALFGKVATVLSSPAQQRRLGDAARREFWRERRHAGEAMARLLDRVFEW
jgi:hypothetical protein